MSPLSATARHAIAEAADRLAINSDTPRLDAELLMAHALGVTRESLLLSRLGDPVPAGFAALVERRAAHEPVAYITGHRAFWTIDLEVGPGVLVPRPDSETLIEAAIAHFDGNAGSAFDTEPHPGEGRGPVAGRSKSYPAVAEASTLGPGLRRGGTPLRAPGSILDLGTGPGTLLLAALAHWPDARGLGVDASAEALAYARRNAERMGLRARADFRSGNWALGIDQCFDLVLCNPPYIATEEVLPPDVVRYEPAGALFAGRDGLNDYRVIATQLPGLIAPGGVGCIEIGASQAGAVTRLMAAQGLAVAVRRDLAGRDRCLVVTP